MNITGELRYHLGDNCATLRFSESGTSLSIDTILVPASHRKRGIGSKLIERVLVLADASHKEVHVAARPIGVTGERALELLVSFYERFGFVRHDRGLTVVYMRRPRV